MAFTGSQTVLTLPGYIDSGARAHSGCQAAIVDTVNGHLYVTTSSSPIRHLLNVIKIQTSDFSYVTTLPSPSTVHQRARSIDIDAISGKLFVSNEPPIGISDWIGATFGVAIPSMGWFGSAAFTGWQNIFYDKINNRVYGCGNSTGNGSQACTYTNVTTFVNTTIPTVPNSYIGVKNNAGTKGFFASPNTDGNIRRVDLATATDEGVIIATGVSFFNSRAVDPVNDMAYFVSSSRGVYKINMATSAIVGSNTLPVGYQPRGACAYTNYNPFTNKMYFTYSGTGSKLGILEIDGNTLTITDEVLLTAYPSDITHSPLAIDSANGFLYVGANITPTDIIRLGITTGSNAVPVSGGPNVKRRPYPYNGATISSAW